MLQGIGYTDDDSAGQTNIFAVEVSNSGIQLCPLTCVGFNLLVESLIFAYS